MVYIFFYTTYSRVSNNRGWGGGGGGGVGIGGELGIFLEMLVLERTASFM